jgi:signal transduction histidine kinase/CheY-like chemotaxis protein
MTSNRFIYMILAAFIAGNLLIIFMQYNSAKNIHNLISGNNRLLVELNAGNQLRELERDLLSSEIKMNRAVATGDTSRLKEVDLQFAETWRLLDSLRAITGNDSTSLDIARLASLAEEKTKLKARILDSFRRTGHLAIENFRAITSHRPLANEVNTASRRIYESRQHLLDSLSTFTNNSGRKAQRSNVIMILLVLVSGAGLFWNVISRIRRQNHLIRQLDASEKQVREISRVKENFMANISHEIRTPMNAVIGFTNLLKSRNHDPELVEFIDAISQSGENLLILINDLLDLSKIEAGMMRIVSAPFSIRKLVATVQTMFMEKMNKKGLQFSVVIDDTIPDTLSGDATRLIQILANMIGNAVKFTPAGSIRVEVSNKGAEPGDKPSPGNTIRLGFVIRDTGIGIAGDKLTAIFERFHQAEDSITRAYGGTGLGLSIVRELVLLQHGEIAVESEPGKGTVFSFSIPYPVAAAHQADRASPAPPVSPASPSPASPSPVSLSPVSPPSPVEAAYDYPDARHISILVVEDNKMNQILLKHLLTAWTLSFDIVDSGTAAIERLKGRPYDLILMDIQMPGMDGYTATREIRTKLKIDTPVFAMTAHAFPGEREKCLSYGMNEYIAKPIDERELYRLIAQSTGIGSNGISPTGISSTRISSTRISPTGLKPNMPEAPPAAYQVIDLEYMHGISEGNKEYEKSVTEQFLEAVPLDIETLDLALIRHDADSIRQTAHNMRSDVAIMGLLEKLQSHLDVLEYEPFDETNFQKAISAVRDICLQALPEARHFYAGFGPRDPASHDPASS